MNHIGRKLYHLLGGLLLLSLYPVLGRERALLFYGVFFAAALLFDLLRLTIPSVNDFVYTHFSGLIRKNERSKLTGTPAYILGIGVSLYFYRTDIAAAAICFLACGDVAATTVGERFGRTKIGDKSLEGTGGFIAATVVAGIVLYLSGLGPSPDVMAIGALVAAGVELLTLPVNDNLVIPLVSGGVMTLVQRFLS